MKKKKKKISSKATVAAISAAGAIFLLSLGAGKFLHVPSYTAERIIDGDTFITTEKQVIRLASTEAPELGLCGSEEAKKELERHLHNQPIYLKVLYRDPYQRLVSQVYTKAGYVNEHMISEGYAYYHNREKAIAEELRQSSEKARTQKKGIFSSSCTQTENLETKKCSIKGNNRDNGKFYFVPDCPLYNNVALQLYLGDQWFCSEKDAIAAGYQKPQGCR